MLQIWTFNRKRDLLYNTIVSPYAMCRPKTNHHSWISDSNDSCCNRAYNCPFAEHTRKKKKKEEFSLLLHITFFTHTIPFTKLPTVGRCKTKRVKTNRLHNYNSIMQIFTKLANVVQLQPHWQSLNGSPGRQTGNFHKYFSWLYS